MATRRRSKRGAAYFDRSSATACRCVACAGLAHAHSHSRFLRAPDPEQEFHAWAVERCGRLLPLDGELVDSVLVKLAPHRYGWYVNAHHLVTDASSTVLLFRHVTSEYAAMSADEPFRQASACAAHTVLHDGPITRLLSERECPRGCRRVTGRAGSRCDRAAAFYGRAIQATSTRSERFTITLDADVSARLREIAEEPGFLSLTADISMFALFATLLDGLAAPRQRSGGASGSTLPRTTGPRPPRKRALGLFIEMFPFAVRRGAGRLVPHARRASASTRRSSSCASRCRARARRPARTSATSC